ncbi:hypothetical protein BHM03_00062144, partial [Ensete ventricosum]
LSRDRIRTEPRYSFEEENEELEYLAVGSERKLDILCEEENEDLVSWRREDMILLAIGVELLEEYTALVTRVLEQLLHVALFPRRVRFLILRRLPFASPPPPLPSPPHALQVRTPAPFATR